MIFGFPSAAQGDTRAQQVTFLTGRIDQPLYDTSVIVDWPLTQVKDRFGNTMNITYNATAGDASNGFAWERWPVAINYTEHPSFPATRAVVFNYHDDR